MHSRMGRLFLLSDAMILIAATAAGSAMFRYELVGFGDLMSQLPESVRRLEALPGGWPSWASAVHMIYGTLMLGLLPFCLVWTIAVIVIRNRQPRPSGRRLVRGPGAVACYSVAAALIWAPVLVGSVLVAETARVFDTESPLWELGIWWSVVLFPPSAGFAVVGSWAVLLIEGRWHCEPSAIDRCGRILGAYWVAAIVLPVWIVCECLTGVCSFAVIWR